MEALHNGSSENLGGPSSESSDSDCTEVIKTLLNSDSESTDYVSPISEPRSGVSALAASDVVVGRDTNMPPLFTSEPLKTRANPMIIMTSQKVNHVCFLAPAMTVSLQSL